MVKLRKPERCLVACRFEQIVLVGASNRHSSTDGEQPYNAIRKTEAQSARRVTQGGRASNSQGALESNHT